MTDFLNAYDVQPDELTISEVAKILRCSRQMVLKIALTVNAHRNLKGASIVTYLSQTPSIGSTLPPP